MVSAGGCGRVTRALLVVTLNFCFRNQTGCVTKFSHVSIEIPSALSEEALIFTGFIFTVGLINTDQPII
ncbi:MAG: hypothetical protein Kow0059_04430 [Candidatus Sumerlaeia bacterium]